MFWNLTFCVKQNKREILGREQCETEVGVFSWTRTKQMDRGTYEEVSHVTSSSTMLYFDDNLANVWQLKTGHETEMLIETKKSNQTETKWNEMIDWVFFFLFEQNLQDILSKSISKISILIGFWEHLWS